MHYSRFSPDHAFDSSTHVYDALNHHVPPSYGMNVKMLCSTLPIPNADPRQAANAPSRHDSSPANRVSPDVLDETDNCPGKSDDGCQDIALRAKGSWNGGKWDKTVSAVEAKLV